MHSRRYPIAKSFSGKKGRSKEKKKGEAHIHTNMFPYDSIVSQVVAIVFIHSIVCGRCRISPHGESLVRLSLPVCSIWVCVCVCTDEATSLSIPAGCICCQTYDMFTANDRCESESSFCGGVMDEDHFITWIGHRRAYRRIILPIYDSGRWVDIQSTMLW